MALPVSFSPPTAYSVQQSAPPAAMPQDAPKDMTLLPADRMAAGPEQNGARMTERQSFQRLQDIRAQMEGEGWVELPVPVTEILRLDLNRASNDAVAGQSAKTLYEGLQDVFARGAPASPRDAMDRSTMRAA